MQKYLKCLTFLIVFLTFFMIGAVAGLVLFSKLISLALEYFPLPTSFFFLGAVAGAIPMIFRAADIKKFAPSVIYLPLIGAVVALSIAMIPEGLLELRNDTIFDLLMSILIQLVGGVFIAAAAPSYKEKDRALIAAQYGFSDIKYQLFYQMRIISDSFSDTCCSFPAPVTALFFKWLGANP